MPVGAHPIRLTPGNGSSLTVVRYLLVSEVTEMFMLAQNRGWFDPGGTNEGSSGEGLSRFLAHEFLIATGLGVSEPGFELAPSWLVMRHTRNRHRPCSLGSD